MKFRRLSIDFSDISAISSDNGDNERHQVNISLMEANLQQNTSGLPKLQLIADELGAKQVSQCFLAGKITSDKIISLNKVHVADRNRIWKKRPWSTNRSHLVLREWSAEVAVRDIDFNRSLFWVQIHGLPLQYMTRENAMKIGGLFKEVLQCEHSSRTNIIGHGRAHCKNPTSQNNLTNDDQYGGEIFDSFSKDTNTDEKDGEVDPDYGLPEATVDSDAIEREGEST
ncbi:hypothetical protein FEM48_Zijuj07G0133500 [Ziziphus jujuba var. spinosa]|uniref:DUF4283 domain-containing protein n=1 Tax=Ziziphus jujuba var. spinosa TaxID=714518 RepID=A0A978V4W0_ZIZJJ|nr:hypothetical protein FEM48_Zijuj07G0133500 [Ziziphus jujuba var. spinosa]